MNKEEHITMCKKTREMNCHKLRGFFSKRLPAYESLIVKRKKKTKKKKERLVGCNDCMPSSLKKNILLEFY